MFLTKSEKVMSDLNVNIEIPSGTYESVNCPNCGDDNTNHCYKLVNSNIVTCKNCELSYVNPRVPEAYVEYILQQWAKEDVVDDARLKIAFESASLEYYGRFISAIECKAILPEKKILDVGCSTGAFLSVARDKGWDTFGLELGEASADYARKKLGLNVTQGTLYEANIAADSLDAISFIEVIEHLTNPLSALKHFHGWLKPDGLLLVTTPNFNSLYRRLFGNRWWVINCEDEHIVLFTLSSLTQMLEDSGFTVEYQYIQGLDVQGMINEFKRKVKRTQKQTGAQDSAVNDYYEARSNKVGLKILLEKLGLLKLVRWSLRTFYKTFTWRWSPFKEWGEQLVIVARRKP